MRSSTRTASTSSTPPARSRSTTASCRSPSSSSSRCPASSRPASTATRTARRSSRSSSGRPPARRSPYSRRARRRRSRCPTSWPRSRRASTRCASATATGRTATRTPGRPSRSARPPPSARRRPRRPRPRAESRPPGAGPCPPRVLPARMAATISGPAPRARLRRADCSGPGLRRRKHGRGFVYLDPEGERIDDPEVLSRIHELVIPPAWQDVWICPYPGGHIQATGIDQAGRKQYLYHPHWRARRDQQKFDDMVVFARTLPALRERVEEALRVDGLGRDHVLACAVRLLDRGFFRVGGEDYAVTNNSYGLATMLKRHVRLRGDVLVFDYPAKHGKRRVPAEIDPEVAETIARLKARSGGGPELLAYKRGRRWVDIRSEDINEYLKATTGEDVSAKDFRKRAVTRAVKEVAHYLGNTPAVARASYIDPRVFDRYRDGKTIAHALPLAAENGDTPAIQGPIEEAVLELVT